MAGFRAILALVALLVIAAPGGVMGQHCVVNNVPKTVKCSGPSGGPLCPDSQTWMICGSVCDNPPEEEAHYCEDDGKITCDRCDVDDMELIWVANTVGSCYC